jgi:hypothetical protein
MTKVSFEAPLPNPLPEEEGESVVIIFLFP